MKHMISATSKKRSIRRIPRKETSNTGRCYVHALRAVSELQIGRCSSLSCTSGPLPDRFAQRNALDIAAGVSVENADFNSWLRTFGTHALFSAGDALCPIFPNRPAPATEAELVSIEAEFNRRYPEAVAIRKHRKCPHTNLDQFDTTTEVPS